MPRADRRRDPAEVQRFGCLPRSLPALARTPDRGALRHRARDGGKYGCGGTNSAGSSWSFATSGWLWSFDPVMC